MEPIIYKPGAYKSPGIYNGSGGVYNGRGVYNEGAGANLYIYHTDFKNFDYSTKIDYPQIGENTQWNTSFTYQKGNELGDDALTIGGNSSTSNTTGIDITPNCEIDLFIKLINRNSRAPVFCWAGNCGVNIDGNYSSNIGFLCSNSITDWNLQSGVTFRQNSYGSNWFNSNLSAVSYKIKIIYASDFVEFYFNDNLKIRFNYSVQNSKLRFDPRYGQMYIAEIGIKDI